MKAYSRYENMKDDHETVPNVLISKFAVALILRTASILIEKVAPRAHFTEHPNLSANIIKNYMKNLP